MQFRHSTVSFAVGGILAACATSGPDNLHGPAYGTEAGSGQEGGGADAGADTTQEASITTDAGGDATTADAPEESAEAVDSGTPVDAPQETTVDTGAIETGTTCTSSMALLAASGTSLAEAVYGHG